ncbi:CvpA family protein [Caenimonas sp. SL110]|uniref:CvpA family protein n=1 Tax=Caenimonas sp. SL110 TaxID=1450524 RepID=UPI000A524178|nr:CvpA family protein [Caenimonas sp. SL110]
MAEVNLIDALLAAIVALGMWGGFRRGFVFAALHLVTLAACFVIAFFANPMAVAWIQEVYPRAGVWAAPVSFIAIFIVAELLIGTLVSRGARTLPTRLHPHPVNRSLGVVPGALNGLLNATLVALVLMSAPIHDGITTATQDSAAAKWLSEPAQWIESQITPIFEPAITRTLRALTTQPEPHTPVKLNFAVTSASPRADLEARMLELVNAERARQGLKPLVADIDLREVARAHSRDMLARGYFAHTTPEGTDMVDRLRKAKLRYLAAGENLALAPSLARAHDGLMNSPGHRANILKPQFARVGIGVLDGGRHGLMITQNFRN